MQTTLPASPFQNVSGKIVDVHIVWFVKSNSWALLEEPAWYVYKNFISKIEESRIIKKFSLRYKISEKDSSGFVLPLIEKFSRFETPFFYKSTPLNSENCPSIDNFYSSFIYKLNGKVIRISYGTKLMEYMFHALFMQDHISGNAEPCCHLELFESAGRIMLKNGSLVWAEEDLQLMKRRLFIEITGVIYNRDYTSWLSFIHGSGVGNGKESIILSTSMGSGKSTLAALLVTQGYRFISDDFIPIGLHSLKVFPFPASLSVKEGSLPVLTPYFKSLETAQTYFFRNKDKSVKYLPLNKYKGFYKPTPVKSILYIKYHSEKENSLKKLSFRESIRKFHEHSWINPSPKHARKFIKWFPGIPCYELVYNSDRYAADQIKKILSPY